MEKNSVNITNRELEVLKYVTQGLTNREIAEILQITHHTVKAHVASLIQKMGVRNRLGISMEAKNLGLID